MFTYLSFAALCNHISSGERLGVGATLLLALSGVDIITSNYVPNSNKWLWINYLTTCSIVFCALATLESCLISHLYWQTIAIDKDCELEQAHVGQHSNFFRWIGGHIRRLHSALTFGKTTPLPSDDFEENRKSIVAGESERNFEKPGTISEDSSTVLHDASAPHSVPNGKPQIRRRVTRTTLMELRSKLVVNNDTDLGNGRKSTENDSMQNVVDEVESKDEYNDKLDTILINTLIISYTLALISLLTLLSTY